MNPRFTYSIKTMGCKANVYDSLLIERELGEMGGMREDQKPDLFILNSCTVTAEADRQSLKEIKNKKKISSETWTVMTGCYAEVAADKIRSNKEVDLVVPGSKKILLKKLVADKLGMEVKDNELGEEIYWGQMPTDLGRTRAFLKIQEGCNDFCTYCIIPFARGKSRSMRLGNILSEVSRLVCLGIQEIVLTGTNIGDYGKEFNHTIEDLIESILTKTNLPRLRLTSLDPTEITPRLVELMKNNSRLMPHFHISLQSPVTRVLRAMKRFYKTQDVVTALERIYQMNPQVFVGMDVIAGFVSETNEEHNEAVQILKNTPWTRLHVFPYSEREGTSALKIKGSVPVGERRERAAELMALSNHRFKTWAQEFVNKPVESILFESVHEVAGQYFISGHAPNYTRVLVRVEDKTKAEALKKTLGNAWIESFVEKPLHEITLEGILL